MAEIRDNTYSEWYAESMLIFCSFPLDVFFGGAIQVSLPEGMLVAWIDSRWFFGSEALRAFKFPCQCLHGGGTDLGCNVLVPSEERHYLLCMWQALPWSFEVKLWCRQRGGNAEPLSRRIRFEKFGTSSPEGLNVNVWKEPEFEAARWGSSFWPSESCHTPFLEIGTLVNPPENQNFLLDFCDFSLSASTKSKKTMSRWRS